MSLLATLGGAALRIAATGNTTLNARSLTTYVGSDGLTWKPSFADEFINGIRLLDDNETGYGWYPRYQADAALGGGGYYAVVRHGDGSLDWGGFSTLPQNGEFEQMLDPRVPEYSTTLNPFIPGPSSVKIEMRLTPFVNNTQWQPFRSGCIISRLNGHGFQQQYGYFEIRMKLPATFGTWPAFWMLASNGYWPPEIDILERFPGYAPDYIATTTHSRAPVTGSENHGILWDGGTHWVNTRNGFVADTSEGFHTYGVEWTPDHIIYKFDRVTFFQHPTAADMHKPFYMIVNFAANYQIMDWPLIPKYMELDWIRCWSMPR